MSVESFLDRCPFGPGSESEIWYVVEWGRISEFVIENARLVGEVGAEVREKREAVTTTRLLAERLKLQGKSFKVVDESTWKRLSGVCTFDFAIPRRVLLEQSSTGSKTFRVEIQPIEVLLYVENEQGCTLVDRVHASCAAKVVDYIALLRKRSSAASILFGSLTKPHHEGAEAGEDMIVEKDRLLDEDMLVEGAMIVEKDHPRNQSEQDDLLNHIQWAKAHGNFSNTKLHDLQSQFTLPICASDFEHTELPEVHPTDEEGQPIVRRTSSTPLAVTDSRGIVGLSNLGNTCYMNSALQCLSKILPLTNFFISGKYKDELNRENVIGTGGRLASCYAKFLKSMFLDSSPYSAFAPRPLKSVIGSFNEQFIGYGQQDSQELLAFLLDGLHEDLNRIQVRPGVENVQGADLADEAWRRHKMRNDSVVVDIFQGQYRSRLECVLCGHVSIVFDPFMYLSVPIPDHFEVLVNLHLDMTVFSANLTLGGSTAALFQKVRTHVMTLLDCPIGQDDLLLLLYKESTSQREGILGLSSTRDLLTEGNKNSTPLFDKENSTPLFDNASPGERNFGVKNLSYLSAKTINSEEVIVMSNNVNRIDVFLLPVWHISLIQGLLSSEEFSEMTIQQHINTNKVSDRNYLAQHSEKSLYKDVLNFTPATLSPMLTTFSPSAETSNRNAFGGHSLATHFLLPTQEPNLIQKTLAAQINRYYVEEKKLKISLRKIHFGHTFFPNKKYTQIIDDSSEDYPISIHEITHDFPLSPSTAYYSRGPSQILLIDCPTNLQTNFKKKLSPKTNSPKRTILSCLEAFLTEEILSDENEWYCPKCKKHVNAKKKIDLWKLPETLILHLKRFQNTGRHTRSKISGLVEFPHKDGTVLDLKSYILPEGYERMRSSSILLKPSETNETSGAPSKAYDGRYELCGVNYHTGGLWGGHYYANVKIGSDWYSFNDSTVSGPISEDTLENEDAYVLFYELKDSHDSTWQL